ncbi:hypothetical protein [Pasteuria penetrans]|uniref:hypothetical protein n=1 Tax=Pasteuria penetrans TaxID=86005 RepID=UPI000FB7C964|nr:hypothetical protein [Pasteuria penetrans]
MDSAWECMGVQRGCRERGIQRGGREAYDRTEECMDFGCRFKVSAGEVGKTCGALDRIIGSCIGKMFMGHVEGSKRIRFSLRDE